jgi:hypothetical protein
MKNNEHIRPLAGIPDHGFGLLGSLGHSVLAEYADASPTAPCLHLGQNTLPDPPFPLPAGIPFGDLRLDWEDNRDLSAFLRTGIEVLRRQPIPDISAFTEEIRLLQRVLRFDSITMAWHDPKRPASALVALATDRAGYLLAGQVPVGGTENDIELTAVQSARDEFLAGLLHELLQAQYTWTTTAFGLVP